MPDRDYFQKKFDATYGHIAVAENNLSARIDALSHRNDAYARTEGKKLVEIRDAISSSRSVLNDMKGQLGDVYSDVSQIHSYEAAAVFTDGLTHMAESIYNAANAFSNGRTREGIAETIRAGAGLTQAIMMASSVLFKGARMLGPMSSVLIGFAEMFVFFVQGVDVEDNSLVDKIEERLRTVTGEEHQYALSALVELFKLQDEQLHGYAPNSIETWDGVVSRSKTLGGGGELVQLFKVKDWIGSEDNQNLEVWEDVFDGYLAATREFLTECETAISVLKKTKTDVIATDVELNITELAAATNFMAAYAKTETNYINRLDDISANWGKFWAIGDNEKIYYGKTHLLDDAGWTQDPQYEIRALVICLGPDERLWHLGNNGYLFTKVPGWNWDGISDTAAKNVSDFSVAIGRDPGVNAVTYMQPDGTIGYFEFDANMTGSVDERTNSKATPRYKVPDAYKFIDITVDDDGRFFGVTIDHQVVMCDATNIGIVQIPNPGGFIPRLVSVGGGMLSIVGTREVRRVRVSNLRKEVEAQWTSDSDAWSTVPVPPDLTDSSSWDYEIAMTIADASLITTIGKRLYLWHGDKWRADQDTGAAATGICGRPASGWESLKVVRDKLTKLEEVLTERKKLE